MLDCQHNMVLESATACTKTPKTFKNGSIHNPTSLPSQVQPEAWPRYFQSIFPQWDISCLGWCTAVVRGFIFTCCVFCRACPRRAALDHFSRTRVCFLWYCATSPAPLPSVGPSLIFLRKIKQTDNTDRVDGDRTLNANQAKLSSARKNKSKEHFRDSAVQEKMLKKSNWIITSNFLDALMKCAFILFQRF